MQHITLLTFCLGLLGLLISISFHLGDAYAKLVNNPCDNFNWGFYFRKNMVDIAKAFLCTLALIFFIPLGMDLLGWGESYSHALALGCGTLNVQLVKIMKKLFEKNVFKKSGLTDEDIK